MHTPLTEEQMQTAGSDWMLAEAMHPKETTEHPEWLSGDIVAAYVAGCKATMRHFGITEP